VNFYDEFLGTAYLTHLKFIDRMSDVFKLKSKPRPIPISLEERDKYGGLFTLYTGGFIYIKHPKFQDDEEFQKTALFKARLISAHESSHYLHYAGDTQKWALFGPSKHVFSSTWKEFVAELGAIMLLDDLTDLFCSIRTDEQPIYAVAREVHATLTRQKREQVLPELLNKVARSSPHGLVPIIDEYMGKGFYNAITENHKKND
jgi:hypothetical protein